MRDIPFAIEDGHSVLRSGEDGTGVTITSGTIDSAPSIQTPSRAGHGSGGRFAFLGREAGGITYSDLGVEIPHPGRAACAGLSGETCEQDEVLICMESKSLRKRRDFSSHPGS